MEYIAAKCPKKSSSGPSFLHNTQAKKQLYDSQKLTLHPDSKTQVGQVLASYLVKSLTQNSPITYVIIDSEATDHFFSNKDFFSIYTEYKHKFQTGIGEKITAHGYEKDDLRMGDLKHIVYTPTVTYMSWGPGARTQFIKYYTFSQKRY